MKLRVGHAYYWTDRDSIMVASSPYVLQELSRLSGLLGPYIISFLMEGVSKSSVVYLGPCL